MKVLYLILLLIAAICFALAAFAPAKVGARATALIPLGLLAWVLVPLIQQIDALSD